MHTIHFRESNVDTGLLRIQPGRLTRAIRVRPKVISIMPCLDTGREQVVRFIRAGYRKCHGARVRVDYPNLISVRDEADTLIAAAGFRFAGLSPLFLEQYTDRPVDEILGASRRGIVEIGNLVSRGGGVSVFLFAALVSYLDAAGISHAVVTGTAALERRLRRMGIEPRHVCAAHPERVAHLGQDWGRYYESQPRVLAGQVAPALENLRGIFGEAFFTRRPRLFPRLHFNPDTV